MVSFRPGGGIGTMRYRIVWRAVWVAVALAVALAASADTYDTHTLVAITVKGPEEVAVLQSCKITLVGRTGSRYKALLTPREFADLAAQGFEIEVLTEEMERDRAAFAVPGFCTNTPWPCYWAASKFNTVNPASGTLMKHLLDLYNAHPTITRLYNLGPTQDGAYDILAMKVTKNPDVVEAEPKLRIYANIHGDEVGGLMVACDVLDWVLANYATDASAAQLVDESEMWFVPMGNPYGNANRQRGNTTGTDLNRDFWSPAYPTDPAFTQKETQLLRDLTEAAPHRKRFTTSLTFHGGEICFNAVYNYTTAPTSDEPIFFSSRTGGPSGGATPAPDGLAAAFQDGCTMPGFWYTNGFDWYQTFGDTNDWAYNRWTQLDTTVEVTSTKWPDTAQIPTYTAQYRQAVLNYLLKTFQGIHGVMTDADTGDPVDGTVEVTATASTTLPVPHPYQAIYTDPAAGDFHRVLQPGTYTVTCKAPGYADTVVTGVVVSADSGTTCNCPMAGTTALAATGSAVADLCSGTGSGGDGVLDPGEDATVQVTLSNAGSRAATGVVGTLTTAVPGVTLVDGTAAFSDVPGGGSAASLAPHFTVRVGASVPCGTAIPLSLLVTSDQGSWTTTVTLTVGAVTPGGGTLFAEGFESMGFPPAGWAITDVSGTSGHWLRSLGTVHPSGASAHGGVALAYFNSYSASNTQSTRFARTVGVAIPAAATGATFSFWMYHDTAYPSDPDRVQPQVSSDGSSWANAGSAVDRYDGSTGWKRHTVDVSAFAGQTLYIGLLGVSGYGNDCHVDDLSIDYASAGSCTAHACTPALLPPGETAPGDLLATAQTWSDKTTQSWPPNAQATGYKVVRGTVGQLPALLNGDTDSSVVGCGAALTFSAPETPGAGDFYWYLVLGTNGAGDGHPGAATAGPRSVQSTGSCP